MTRSYWRSGPPFRAEPLAGRVKADVCIVGGGWAGLSTAYFLAREGVDVALVEAEEICGGESARTTAHLASAQDDRLFELERMHGRRTASLVAQSHAAAIDRVEQIVSDEGIDCGFRRLSGYLFADSEQDEGELDDERAACVRARLPSIRRSRVRIGGRMFPALEFPRQATLAPVEYLRGLAAAAGRRGARLYSRTRVTAVSGGESPVVRCGARTISCGAVVLATNAPIDDRVSISSRQTAYRTYAVAMRVRAGKFRDALYWDLAEPYHYLRLDEPGGKEVLIVGGEDHRVGNGEDLRGRFERLETWTRERFSGLGRVKARWSGQVQEPADGLAFIGEHPTEPGNVYIATGDSGQGTTHGTLAGVLLTDLVLGRRSRWEDVYSPSRPPPLGSLPEVAIENADNALQYLDHFLPPRLSPPATRRSGAVIMEGLARRAVYRGADGKLVDRSAVCPHLGGLVRWNECELSWDCPVHGSRYRADGTPICGPTNAPLGD